MRMYERPQLMIIYTDSEDIVRTSDGDNDVAVTSEVF